MLFQISTLVQVLHVDVEVVLSAEKVAPETPKDAVLSKVLQNIKSVWASEVDASLLLSFHIGGSRGGHREHIPPPPPPTPTPTPVSRILPYSLTHSFPIYTVPTVG